VTNVILSCPCGAETSIPVYNVLFLRRLPHDMQTWADDHRATGCQLLDQPPKDAA
jgi:hypothetical protein